MAFKRVATARRNAPKREQNIYFDRNVLYLNFLPLVAWSVCLTENNNTVAAHTAFTSLQGKKNGRLHTHIRDTVSCLKITVYVRCNNDFFFFFGYCHRSPRVFANTTTRHGLPSFPILHSTSVPVDRTVAFLVYLSMVFSHSCSQVVSIGEFPSYDCAISLWRSKNRSKIGHI